MTAFKNKFSLSGKKIILTGGSGFLALEFSKEILNFEGEIILVDINLKQLKIRARDLAKEYGHRIHYFKCDLSSELQVKNLFKKIQSTLGVPDILINNAASNPKMINSSPFQNNFENFSISQWNKDFAAGLTSAFLCTKYFGKINSKKDRVILNISSDLGIIAPNQNIYNNKVKDFKPVSYSVIKHGIIGLTKYTATFWNKKNIRCNAVAFGGVYNNQDKEFLSKLKKLIPMNRMAVQSEYNSAIIFLISDASSYMNGSVTIIDGGRSSW